MNDLYVSFVFSELCELNIRQFSHQVQRVVFSPHVVLVVEDREIGLVVLLQGHIFS